MSIWPIIGAYFLGAFSMLFIIGLCQAAARGES